MASITLSFDGAVAVLTLSAPRGNRFGREMVDEMDLAIDELSARQARAIVLRADGPRLFAMAATLFLGRPLRRARSTRSSRRFMSAFKPSRARPDSGDRSGTRVFVTAAAGNSRCVRTFCSQARAHSLVTRSRPLRSSLWWAAPIV